MTTGKFTLVIRWPSGQSTICGEMTDHQHGEICRILSPDYRAQLPSQGGEAVEPVAYAAFADNGNIRMWCRSAIGMCELLDEHGNKAVPLYTAPPSPDAELVELLRELSAIGKAREAGYADRLHGGVLNHKCAGALVSLLPRIDAKLASLKP